MDAYEEQSISPLTLFYSYADANEDEKLREKLETHLSVLQRQGKIAGLHRHKIMPGANKNQVSEEQFSSAQIILLLITPDFLALDTSYTEMKRALQRHEDGLAHVIPLLLRPVDWESAPFAHLQALPRDGLPVTKWENRDEAFADIAKDIRSAIEQWKVSHALFLSSARKDLSLINRLKDDLQAHGITGWANHKATPEEKREPIRNASAVILVASPHTRRSSPIKNDLRIAEMYQRPVYLFWMEGNDLIEVIPTGWSHLLSFDARTERYPQALQDLLQALGKETSPSSYQDHSSKQSTPSLEAPRNPYKGLQAFRVEDAQDFFGRDRLIEELVEKVQQLLTMDQQDKAASRLLTVLGPSGSGKSSVVMAGLLPRLKQGMLPGSQNWIYLDPMVPGKHPLEALILTLAPLFPERGPMSILEDLKDDSARGLHLLLMTYVKQSDVNVVLVIDQFEELFTQTATEDERRQFLDLLLAATSERHGPLVAVLTLRADFYDRPMQYPEFYRMLDKHHISVLPMENDDLRRVIEQPAQLPDVQLIFDANLVGDLLFEMQGQAGALPLLQFTLDQLFQQRDGHRLSLRAYHKIGGVKGALSQHAEETYKALPSDAHRRLARDLFLRLIEPGIAEQDTTRRRAARSEFDLAEVSEKQEMQVTLEAFIKARLLTTNQNRNTTTVEVSHEALLREWLRLADWVSEARKDLHLQHILSEDVVEWEQHKRPKYQLYRGVQLKEAQIWAKHNRPSQHEEAFLRASEVQRILSFVSLTVVVLLLVSSMGVIGWYLFLQPSASQNEVLWHMVK